MFYREFNRSLIKAAICLLLIIHAVCASAALCASGSKDSEILVSAAISLKNAFEEIGSVYAKRTGIKVRFNLGASGLLQRQIESGAPVDVFASAGEKQMDELQARGLIQVETRRDFARNTLVLIIPSGSKLRIHAFADLASPEVARIAVGNPKTVPAGQYAREALSNLNLWDRLQSRLVMAENVRQVLDYVVRGETEAGFVYASDVPAAHGGAAIAAAAPDNSHRPILYPIAVVKAASAQTNARRFIDMVLSPEGQSVLKKHGFSGAQ